MTREELIKIVEEIPEEFLGAYSLELGTNRLHIQMHFQSDIARAYCQNARVSNQGYVEFVTHIAGRRVEVTLT